MTINIENVNNVNEDSNKNENETTEKQAEEEKLLEEDRSVQNGGVPTSVEEGKDVKTESGESQDVKTENGESQDVKTENGESQDVKTENEESQPLHPHVRRPTEIAEELLESGEVACGIGCLRGKTLQRFANKKAYVVLYGVLGCVMGAAYSYLNGTITTIEKRFKIPSTNTGIIMTGGDISQMVLCLFLNYYAGRGHRPRWIAFGVYTVVVFCFMNALPHLLYGPGQDALDLTEEHGGEDDNTTAILVDGQNRKALCLKEGAAHCDDTAGNFSPQVILFLAQLISGVGGSLYYTLGVSYMDDNIKKSKTPALVSFSYFLRMLGPAIGYALASGSLSLYISPSLTPTITNKDPRWLGAWWLGWLLLAGLLFVFASLLALFPRSLPRAAMRRVMAAERRKAGLDATDDDKEVVEEIPTSFKDMTKTFRRLCLNKTLMCNNFASVFYFMGYMPYWVFMPKYIETIYKQSASAASFITGFVGLVFSAIGILVSGLFISKFRPSARFLAAWNVVVGFISIMGIVSYAFLGCPVNDRQGLLLASGQMDTTSSCNADCHCDYVKYSPVCTPDGRTFISPCHAGCRDYKTTSNGSKVYLDCSCVPEPPQMSTSDLSTPANHTESVPWVLKEGPCPVDCSTHFYFFLAIVCVLKFSGATGRTSNFLVSVRCVDDKDKTVAMGLGLMFMSLFAFIPSPILFGYFIDMTCLVWGKTCSGTGNCWLYNAEMLRYLMNFTAAGFVSIGTVFDFGVWYYVKDLKIFDEEVEMDVAPQRAKTMRK